MNLNRINVKSLKTQTRTSAKIYYTFIGAFIKHNKNIKGLNKDTKTKITVIVKVYKNVQKIVFYTYIICLCFSVFTAFSAKISSVIKFSFTICDVSLFQLPLQLLSVLIFKVTSFFSLLRSYLICFFPFSVSVPIF